MFKSIAASWSKSSLADKVLITYIGICATTLIVRAVAAKKD